MSLLESPDTRLSLPNNTTKKEMRTIVVEQASLSFYLQRSSRKSIGLSITHHGLTITAPRKASLSSIDQAVRSRYQWIQSKLALQQQYQNRHAQAQDLLHQQQRCAYLGVLIKIQPSASHTYFQGKLHQPSAKDTLFLTCSNHYHDLEAATTHWLQQQAYHWLGLRLAHFISKTPHSLAKWQLSNARTRWGSCSSRKSIRLNWRLIHFKPAMIDYVVAHEVAHLREMNHSPAFWAEVARLMPDFTEARAELKHYHPGQWPAI